MSKMDFSDLETIAFLTDALTAAGVDGLEISGASGQLRIVISAKSEVRTAGMPPAQAFVVKATMAGIFCLQRPGSAGTSADLPRSVTASEVLGFLRIGPILLPISAGRAGLLTRRVAQPDTLVGFGDALFEIEPQP